MENNQNQGQQNWQAGNAPYGQQPYTQGYQNQPYGQQPYYQGGYGYGPSQPEQPGKGLGIAGMVCGILSLLLIFVFMPLGIGCGIAGLVMGIIGRKKNKKDGMALAGIITSSIGLGLSVLLIILVVVLVGAAFGAYGFEYFDYFLNAAQVAALGAGLIL